MPADDSHYAPLIEQPEGVSTGSAGLACEIKEERKGKRETESEMGIKRRKRKRDGE